MQANTVFSGAQPTGDMTLGNYLGAIKQWVELQDNNQCLFCIVDLHALTSDITPKVLTQNTLSTFALFLACGLDPKKSTIFIQSQVAEHTELAWLLQTKAYLGELNRMTQFKDKSARYEKNLNLGLYTYPTLMAADILLYNTNIVPVGEDQKQHLELTRDLAIRFNNKYGDTFNIPQPYILDQGARIMSLQDPNKKMSKSDINTQGFISLLDSSDLITKKIKRAVTDSEATIKYDANRAGISNLINIYAGFTNKSIVEIELQYQNYGYGVFKADLAQIIINKLESIQTEYNKLINDKEYLAKIIQSGQENARQLAQPKLKLTKSNLGLI